MPCFTVLVSSQTSIQRQAVWLCNLTLSITYTFISMYFCSNKLGKHWLHQSKISWTQDILEYLRFVLTIQEGIMCRAGHFFFFFLTMEVLWKGILNMSKALMFCKILLENAGSSQTSNGTFTQADLYKKQFLK